MSSNPTQPSKCQNCHSLRLNADALCKLASFVKSLQSVISCIQPIIDGVQPIIDGVQPIIDGVQPIIDDIQQSSSNPDPVSLDNCDSVESGTGDENDVDGGALDNTVYCDREGSGSTTKKCPHPNCAHKTQIYAQGSSLRRHFNNHVTCNEVCLLCGQNQTTIHKYISHFGSCQKKENSPNLGAALKKKVELCKRGRDELRRISEESTPSSRMNINQRNGGGKRKASSTEVQSQRRRVDTSLKGTTESTSFLFNGIPQWNGYEDQSLLDNRQFQPWPPRAGFCDDYTVDWSNEYERQCAANAIEQTPLLPNSIDLFQAGSMGSFEPNIS